MRYNPQIHSSIEEYLRQSKRDNTSPLFEGSQPFNEMYNKLIICPQISGIRMCHSVGGDEFYLIENASFATGLMDVPVHKARNETIRIEELLNQRDEFKQLIPWEPLDYNLGRI